MDTLLPASLARHVRLRLPTADTLEFVDITDRVTAVVAEAGLGTGFVNVQTCHTTTAIVVNEHEPLLLEDFRTLLDATAPADGRYRHDDMAIRRVNLTPGERVNGHAHCRALFLPASACLNVVDGALQLGRWQRVFLVELDGPRVRDVSILLVGEARS
jgi:secondary thiamine-phosphate synthase enzyme